MDSRSQWWRWVMVIILPLLLFIDKQHSENSKTAFLSESQKATLGTGVRLKPLLSTQVFIHGENRDADNAKLSFREFWKQRLNDLPTELQLRDRAHRDNFHHTPREVMEGGNLIGEVTEKVVSHPELREEAMSFYQTCAMDSLVLKSLRGVCLRSLWNLKEKLNQSVEESEYPNEIVSLAKQLPHPKW